MSAADALISAMHQAGGSTPRLVSEWLTLAQEHAALRDAFRATHGKRLPTPPKLGLWLSEREGKTAGPLRLEGRYSAKRKARIYRVIDYVKVAEVARQEAERQAQIRAQFEESQRQRVAAIQAAAAQAQEPATDTPRYEYEPQRYDSTGKPLALKILTDPRTGQPVKAKRAEPQKAASAPEQVSPTAPSDDNRPPWMRANRQPTRAEWDAWQEARTGRKNGHAPEAVTREQRLGPEPFFARAFPGNGVAPGSGEYQGPFGFYTRVAGR